MSYYKYGIGKFNLKNISRILKKIWDEENQRIKSLTQRFIEWIL